MGKKGYVIQKLGYEYNDETYYRPEDGGGNPMVVIMDEIVAKKKLMELEIEAWRGENIGHYGYDMREVTNNESEFERALEAIGLDTDNWWDMEIPKSATDEQIKNLIKASIIRFHEIVEVEVEDISELSDEDIQPSESMLSNQEALAQRGKKGIFDGVGQFESPKVTPIVIPDNITAEDIKKVVSETNDDFLTIKEQMKTLRDEARAKVKNFFIKGMDKIFEMFPEVKEVRWTQYTPYSNDGEECTFSAGIDYFDVNGYDQYDDEDDDSKDFKNVIPYEQTKGNWHTNAGTGKREWRYDNPESRAVKIKTSISGFLSQLDNDDYKTMFGDHAEVIVRKGEITIEEYDHD